LIIFDKYVIEKVSNQKYLTFPPHLTSVSTLPGECRSTKSHPFTQMLYYCIARLQPVAGLIYSVLLLTTDAHVQCHRTS